jgi:hypothetical protein
MGVAADDDVGPGLHQHIGQRLLERRRAGIEFDPPAAVSLLTSRSGHDLDLGLRARGPRVLSNRWLGDQSFKNDRSAPIRVGSDGLRGATHGD